MYHSETCGILDSVVPDNEIAICVNFSFQKFSNALQNCGENLLRDLVWKIWIGLFECVKRFNLTFTVIMNCIIEI